VALLYAHLQITEARRAEREANANELWRETLRLGFDNPKLSDPSLKLADFDYDKLTIDGSRELFQKYEIYVDTVLNASDEILEISPTEDWKTSLRIQLLPHRDYLLSPHFKQSATSTSMAKAYDPSCAKFWTNLSRAHARKFAAR
jgi:hypothetical protein